MIFICASLKDYTAQLVKPVPSLSSVVFLCVAFSAHELKVVHAECDVDVAYILRSQWCLVVDDLPCLDYPVAPADLAESSHSFLVFLSRLFPCRRRIECFCKLFHVLLAAPPLRQLSHRLCGSCAPQGGKRCSVLLQEENYRTACILCLFPSKMISGVSSELGLKEKNSPYPPQSVAAEVLTNSLSTFETFWCRVSTRK